MEYFLIVVVIILFLIIIMILTKKNPEYDFEKLKGNYENEIAFLKQEINKKSQEVKSDLILKHEDFDSIANELAIKKFENWKEEYEEIIRNNAAAMSKSKILSSVDSQMMPLLGIGWFPGKFYEARFIGNPITYVVFKNLDNKEKDMEIEFVEITNKNIMKAGRVKQAIEKGKVKFTLIDKKD